MKRSAAVCVVAILVCELAGQAWAEGWAGTVVFPRRENTPLKYGTKVVSEFSYSATVLKEHGDWLEVRHNMVSPKFPNSYQGFLPKKDVVRSDEAVKYFTSLISGDGKNAWAYVCRAKAWQLKGENQIAIADFSEALRLKPEAWVYNLRGILWDDLKDYDKALADYNDALRLDPKDASVWNNAGNSRRSKGDYDKALANLNEALWLKPDYAVAFANRGLTWSSKGDYEQAIADFNEAIRLDPNYNNAFANRGLAWLNQGDYERAIADFNEAIRLDPNDGFAYVCKASACLVQEQGREAFDVCRNCIEHQGWTGSHATYAVILGVLAARRSGDTAAAERLLGEAQGKLSEAWPHDVVRFLAGQLDAPGLLALAKDNGQQTEAHCYLALQALIDGHADEAKSHLQWVIDNGDKGYIEYSIALAERQRWTAEP